MVQLRTSHISNDAASADRDVATERERVLQGCDDIIQAHRLRKEFRRDGEVLVAVKDLTFGIPQVSWYRRTVSCQGECFGLLGVNGAGKTTTLAMLTGTGPVYKV